ncbi:MAG: hypothetical protein HYS13_08795 [Planctomycetia bacterium]|nr:hypothetical protein [Planctomycetia bacterium]
MWQRLIFELAVVLAGALFVTEAQGAEKTFIVRVVWGGGAARQWQGTVQLQKGRLTRMEALGVEADEPGSMWIWNDTLFIRQRSLRTFDGVDLTVRADSADVLVLDLRPDEEGAAGQRIQVPLATLISAHHQEPLDEKGNRLLVARAPGGALELTVRRSSLVFSPGEVLDVTLRPNLLPVANGTAIKLTAQFQRLGDAEPAWSDRQQLVWNDAAQPTPEFPYKITLPTAEGVYELTVEATADSITSRLWNKGALASRKMQVVVVDLRRRDAETVSWKTELEIDPTHHSWWQRVANVPIPWVKDGIWPKVAGPAESETAAATRMHSLGRLTQLPPADAAGKSSWAVYPLTISRPGEPYLLEVDYPSDVPQTLLVSLVETDASGRVIALGLDSGVYLPHEAKDRRSEWLKHRVVLWPRTASTAVLLANPSSAGPATFGKLRVLSGAGRLPPATPPDLSAGRAALAYLEKPLLGKTFTATEEYDAWSGRTFETWSTFYEGGTRLAEYLHYAGYSGAIVGVACDGAAIYPSEVLQPTPRYDGGMFLIAGHDPVRKDVLELLLRLFDRERLQFIPAIDFSAPLPELEEILRRGGPDAVGIEWVGPDGLTLLESQGAFGGSAPYYNVLNPRVQEAMRRAVSELVRRCAKHPSFSGLALQLSAQGYCQLPGAEWGFDDATIAQFERDTKVQVKYEGQGGRYVQRARFLLSPQQRNAWLAWRAATLRQFYVDLWREAAKANNAARLHLCTGRMLDSPQWNARLRPTLSGGEPGQGVLLELGLDESLLTDTPQVVFYRPTLSAPLRSVGQQATQLEVEHAAWLDRAGLGKHLRAAMVYHVPQEVNLQARSAGGELASGGAWLVSQPLPSDAGARKALAHALALQDAGLLAEGGWQLPRGQEESTREFLSVFRQLPLGEFRTIEGKSQPVVFRAMNWKGATYVYLVNDSPWRAKARVRINGAPQLVLNRLSAAGPVAVPLRNDGQGSVWEVELGPYELAAGFVSVSAAAVTDPQVELDPAVLAELSARIDELAQTVTNLREPKWRGGPPNAGFDEVRAGRTEVPSWELLPAQGTAAQLDAREKAVGQHSVRLTSDGPTAVLLSQPFAPPRTGRLAVKVWARTLDAKRPPLLRLVLEGDYRGRAYVRHAVIGQSAAPLEDHFRQYVFPVHDVPFEGLSPLRLRFELIGPGVVWLDDVQTCDALFDRDTELFELSKIVTLAVIKRRQLQPGDCQRILESYWPRYLAAYAAESGESPTAEANVASPPEMGPPTAAGGAAAPPSSAPAPSNEPGFLDRMKGYLPDFMRR